MLSELVGYLETNEWLMTTSTSKNLKNDLKTHDKSFINCVSVDILRNTRVPAYDFTLTEKCTVRTHCEMKWKAHWHFLDAGSKPFIPISCSYCFLLSQLPSPFFWKNVRSTFIIVICIFLEAKLPSTDTSKRSYMIFNFLSILIILDS